MPFTDLDTSTVDSERAAIHITGFLVWWFQAGRYYYGRRRGFTDGALCMFVNDSISAVGGWREARRILRRAGV